MIILSCEIVFLSLPDFAVDCFEIESPAEILTQKVLITAGILL